MFMVGLTFPSPSNMRDRGQYDQIEKNQADPRVSFVHLKPRMDAVVRQHL